MKVGTYECLYFCYDTITIDSSVTTFKVPIVETNVFNLCPGDDIICTKFNMVKKQLTPKNLCITCEISSPSQPYFDEVSNTCVATTSCPTGSANSVTNKACIKCSNISSYKSLTHTNKIVIDFNHCFYCETTNKYMLNLDGVCLSTCPTNYLFDSEKNCYCNLYLDGNNCVAQCPGNLGANTITKMCVNCKNETTLSINYNHVCRAPSNMPTTTVIIDTTYNVAVDCITANTKVYNAGCVDICPNLTTIYSGGNECFAWKPIGKYMNNNLIVNSCPTNYFFDLDNVCKDCNILTNEQKKSTTCVVIVTPTPAPTPPLTCAEQNKQDFYGYCYDTCPSNSKVIDSGKKCECPIEYSKPNQNKSDCDMLLTAELDYLSKLDILQISPSQRINFEKLAMEQVKLMQNNTIPLNENYLDSLDFALALEQ